MMSNAHIDLEVLKRAHTYCLVIGSARSGSTLLGTVINAHSQAVIANETWSSGQFWRRLTRDDILADIARHASADAPNPRSLQVHQCPPDTALGDKRDICVVGDKIWNPATLMLHGKPSLIPSLEERMQARICLVHSVRNPFDTISTASRKSGMSIKDRIRWCFMHYEAVAALHERLPAAMIIDVHHEDLLAEPDRQFDRLCQFLRLPTGDEHMLAIRKSMAESPRRTSADGHWTAANIDDVLRRIEGIEFLRRYRHETPESRSPERST